MMQPQLPPRAEDPLVRKNPFLERTCHAPAIMPFGEARPRLPAPVLPEHSGWLEMYWRAWEIAWSNLHRARPQSGFVANYIDPAADGHVFMWDTAFMMRFGLYGRRAFHFMGSLDNFYAQQHRDGFMCRQIHGETGEEVFFPFDPNGTGPNILAWAEWAYYRATGDDSRLADVFWPLLTYHRWCRAHRTWPGGLYWATGLSSGMENQSRVPGGEMHHRHWTWIDASIQATLNCRLLWQMAEMLDLKTYAEELIEERTRLIHDINAALWDEASAFYCDVDPKGRHSPVKSIAAYWALLDPDLVPADRLAPFVKHLRDPEVFRRLHRVPAQAADSDGYDPTGATWRGGVWPPTTYMVLKGLRVAGQHALAHEIALNHLDAVCQVFEHTDTLWQSYASETTAPGENARPHHVGWTGLSPIAILLEDVIGLQVDWPQRRVTWDRRLVTQEPYGVRQFPLGASGVMDLVADDSSVTVTTNVPLTLVVQTESSRLQLAVPAGTTEVELA